MTNNIQPLPEIDIEMALLGALLMDINEGILKVIDAKLRPSDFLVEANGKIFSVILALWERHRKVDIITVNEELINQGQDSRTGGLKYLNALWDNACIPAYVQEYAETVVEKSNSRELHNIFSEILERIKHPESKSTGILDLAEQKVFAIRDKRENKKSVFLPDEAPRLYSEIFEMHMKGLGNELPGLPTGYRLLDNLIGGFQPSDLIVLGGRPGMGKTSLALNLVLNAALPCQRQAYSDMPACSVAFFSLEMSEKQILQRILC
jgi:replicative DNA helicase